MRRLLALLWLAGAAWPQTPFIGHARVGFLRDGYSLLPTGWLLKPAGSQMDLDASPIAAVLSPDGKYLLSANAGHKQPFLSVVSLETGRQIQRLPVEDVSYGLAFTPNGRLVYLGGGSGASIYEFTFSPEGRLEAARTFELVHRSERTPLDYIGDVRVSPDARLLYAASLLKNKVLVINPQSGRVIEEFKVARRPCRILFHPDGKSFFVSSWADAVIEHLEAETGRPLGVLRTGPHPTEMIFHDKKIAAEADAAPDWTIRLFVAAAHTNNVYVFGANESKDFRFVETINVGLTRRQPVGMTPSALALSEDGSRLFVVCSGANAVAVVDVTDARSRVLGFQPTGWYPAAARALSGKRLAVFSAKGSSPAAAGGSLEFLPDPGSDLAASTRTVIESSFYRDELLESVPAPPNSPVPATADQPSPIEHVVYIVKGNLGYDQVFGQLGRGSGNPSLTVFGENVTPNHHRLAREFVQFDNFYSIGDGEADGRLWSTAAIVPDFVQRIWCTPPGGRRRTESYDEGEPAAIPPAGYLWTQAMARGLSVRNYGHLVVNKPKAAQDGVQVESVRDGALRGVTNFYFRGPDPEYSDVGRARAFLAELAQFEVNNNLPRLIVMRLGNDLAAGEAPGRISRTSAVAGNDYALGLIVEALSRARFWPKTAVFVLENSGQAGADHVDPHRTPAFILSPFTRRGVIDSRMYNTTSMLRTIELILGLRPMTVFDAAARPMHTAFQADADARPYTADKPKVPLDHRNPDR